MMKKKLVSVIIPVYNVENYLRRCVESVLNQTFKNFELILVNDGSKDDSLKICKEFEKSDPRVIVIDTPNRGSSSARNTGMSIASGEWIIHFDSDDWIEQDMLQLLYDEAITEDADIVACGIYEDYGNDNRIAHLYPYEKLEPHSEIFRMEGLYSSVCNKLIKKELYDKHDIHFVNGVRMWEDLVVSTRLRFFSKKSAIVNKPLYHYYCAPRESICIEDAKQYPHSQIRVVEYLTDYLNSLQSSDPIIQKIIASIKISAKNYLFSLESEQAYNQWKYMYSEANKDILELKHIPLQNRLLYYMASILSYKNYMFMRGLKRKIFS